MVVTKYFFGAVMGRHREFDLESVLDAAVNVFWEHGYEGASMADLVSATGVAAPGLYAAFGNKQSLFLHAVKRYETHRMQFVQEALRQPTARSVVEYLLNNNTRLLAGDSSPAGCLGINGALAVSPAAEPVREELVRRRHATEAELRKRFEQARTNGDLPVELEPEDLARYVVTLVQGMAVQAKAGATLAQLERLVAMALRIWPGDP
jgi:AcrR family transcriptional regulator